MKTLLRFVLAAALLGGAAACDSDQKTETEPAPAPAYTLMRAIVYPTTSELAGVKYAPQEITGAGGLDNQSLSLLFSTQSDNTALTFTISAAQLKAGLVGNYPLKSRPDQTTGVVATHYALPLGGTLPTRLFDSVWNTMTGHVQVTSYDERRRLISGNYEVVMNDLADPLATTLDNSMSKRANLTLSGEFSHLPLK